MTTNLAISELTGAVDRPIAEAVGLPNRAYTSPEFFRLELERIFAPSWACLGHAAGRADRRTARGNGRSVRRYRAA